MALVGNKADLHEKREVPTEVSLHKLFQLDSVEILLSHAFFSAYHISLTGWDGACREERHVLY